MKNYLKLLVLTSVLFLSNNWVSAVSAYPYPIEYTQTDGSKITIILKGDEHVKWAQTLDGYSILRNSKGLFEYAILDSKNDMIPSGVRVLNQKDRSDSDRQFLNKIKKGIIYSKSQVGMMKSISQMVQKSSQKSFPTTGSRKLVCILIGFTDKAFTKTQSDYNNLFNQVGYTTDGATGSVKDYYAENSYNQLDLTVTVAGPYTAAHNMAYYGANDAYGNDADPRSLVTEAVTLANPTVNYADFDNDGNGSVDGVYVIYAGYGEEAGASANAIWAHAWQIPTQTLDGKTIANYSCSPELRGTSGTGITRIGVICHEFGHVMGAADYYDTDYSDNGQYDGTADWDIMASGSWNNDGATPAQHNPYTKIFDYGWTTATTLNSGTIITLTNAEQNSNSFYRVNTATANEFFLIENRQQHKFDSYIPGHGMIIYHVDGSYISVHKNNNDINAGSHQGMYPVCASATGNPPTSYGTINGGGCPFPGTGSKTSFTDATTPNSKSWAVANTSKPITAISENSTDKTVSFTFMGGTTCTPPTIQATTFTSSAMADNSMTIGWTRGNGNTVLVVARKGSAVNEDPTNGLVYTANVAFGSGDQVGAGNYVVYSGVGTSENISSLTSGTTYYYSIYEYNTATNCYLAPALTGNAATTGVAPISYCNAASDECDEYISNVSFGTINNSTSCTSGGYADYTSLSTNIAKGSALTINVANGNAYTSDQCGVWVDWNNNGDFLDDQAITVSGTPSNYSATIICPSGATSGLKRVRIRIHYNDEVTSPCDNATFGEVEDYSINVIEACTPPTTQSSIFTSDALTSNSMTIGWTRGDGNAVLVVAKAGSAVDADPISGTNYSANAIFGSGTQLGTGNYVVYSGTGTSINVSGLSSNKNYYFAIYEYSATNCYLTPALTGNATTLCITPNAPTVGSVTQPTTSVTTGSVVLNGLPSSGTWALTRTPGGIVTTGTGTSKTIAGLASGTYTYTVTNASGCVSAASANVVINAQTTGIFDNNSKDANYLGQNYPNPFDQSTTIDFSVIKPGNVKLSVFNTLGKEIDVIVNEFLSIGNYSRTWMPKGVAPGIYFYQLKGEGVKETKRLLKK